MMMAVRNDYGAFGVLAPGRQYRNHAATVVQSCPEGASV